MHRMLSRRCVWAVAYLLAFTTLSAGADKVPATGPAAAVNAPAAQVPGDDTLILDGTGYFRQHIEFGLMRLNGQVLRSEGDKLFGNRLPRLEQDIKKLLKDKGYDWAKTDWRDVASFCFMSAQVSDDRAAIAALPAVQPPADWAKPDFDDSGFDLFHMGLPSRQSIGWIVYDQSGKIGDAT